MRADGTPREPVSGFPDGFGNGFNMHFWRMQAYRGALLVGTNDWSWSLRSVPGLDAQIRAEFGFDLFATCDGSDWWAATRDGFGDGRTDFGVRTMAASPAGLFVGTTNHVRGAGGLPIPHATVRRTPAAVAGRRTGGGHDGPGVPAAGHDRIANGAHDARMMAR